MSLQLLCSPPIPTVITFILIIYNQYIFICYLYMIGSPWFTLFIQVNEKSTENKLKISNLNLKRYWYVSCNMYGLILMNYDDLLLLIQKTFLK